MRSIVGGIFQPLDGVMQGILPPPTYGEA